MAMINSLLSKDIFINIYQWKILISIEGRPEFVSNFNVLLHFSISLGWVDAIYRLLKRVIKRETLI